MCLSTPNSHTHTDATVTAAGESDFLGQLKRAAVPPTQIAASAPRYFHARAYILCVHLRAPLSIIENVRSKRTFVLSPATRPIVRDFVVFHTAFHTRSPRRAINYLVPHDITARRQV